jgi:phospholipid transport system substrate-binding protein
MMHILKALLVISMLCLPTQLQAEESPYTFVNSVASSTFVQMKQDQALIKSDPKHIALIVDQQLMPHVDHVYAALSVLGTQARQVPREKLNEYFAQFRLHLLATYSNTLSSYTNQVVEFEPTRAIDGKKIVSVKGVIKTPGKPDIDITFQVRRNKEGEWKAFDLIAEGISLVQSKRSEFAPMLRQNGIDSVIAFMREQNSKPVK